MEFKGPVLQSICSIRAHNTVYAFIYMNSPGITHVSLACTVKMLQFLMGCVLCIRGKKEEKCKPHNRSHQPPVNRSQMSQSSYLIERSTKIAKPSVLKPGRLSFTILYLKKKERERKKTLVEKAVVRMCLSYNFL